MTGVDISAKHIEMAQVSIPRATFIQADRTKLDFAENSFDGIVAFYAFFHLPREEQAARLLQISSWLRPGGMVVATFGVYAVAGDVDEDWLGTTMYWSSYSGETNRQLVEDAGLQILSAMEETTEEMGRPISFMWIVAQK